MQNTSRPSETITKTSISNPVIPNYEVPTLNISDFTSNDPILKRNFVEKLGAAYQGIGFVVITGHKIAEAQQKEAYQKIADFFALPSSIKEKYELPNSGGARGYTTFGKEHAKYSNVGDLKEFYHYGMDLPKGHELEKEYPANLSVSEIENFNTVLKNLYQDLLSLGMNMLQAIALHLELPENYFDEKVRYGNSILRPIHYPPLRGDEAPDALRSAEHEDINLITLLIGASSPGLEVKDRNGKWVAITTGPNEIVVNVGDMLQRLTNYKLVSTTHRVANPPSKESIRFSIPFFLHPVSRMSLKALESCVPAGTEPRDPETTAGEYLDERLREIGLK